MLVAGQVEREFARIMDRVFPNPPPRKQKATAVNGPLRAPGAPKAASPPSRDGNSALPSTPAAKITSRSQESPAAQALPRPVRANSLPLQQRSARPIPVRVVDNCPPLTTCIHCHEGGDVKRIVDASRPGTKSETLHPGCAQAWFAKLQGTRLDDPELTPYSSRI
jgi:hypothetical protein